MSDRSPAEGAGIRMAGGTKRFYRLEVGPVRGADGTCPVCRKVLRTCPGLDMGEWISPLRFVLEHLTDIAAIEGHAEYQHSYVR
jgi:hypothetical protein